MFTYPPEQVRFGAECLSEVHIAIDGVANISLNLTSSDKESGEVTYDLSSLISPETVCSVRGVVYGSNEVRDTAPVPIQPPSPEGKVKL